MYRTKIGLSSLNTMIGVDPTMVPIPSDTVLLYQDIHTHDDVTGVNVMAFKIEFFL